MAASLPAIGPLVRQARALTAALVGGGRGGGTTAGLMLLGGLLEGIGLFMLVPLAGLLVGSEGRSRAVAARLFAALGADSRLTRLAVLLALFVTVMAVRAVVILLRDRQLAALRLGFVERERVALIRALAAARWQDVAALRHARVTAALGSDIQRVAAAAYHLLQSGVAAVMMAAQLLLVLLIAPPLAVLAAALLAGGGVATVPSLRRAARIGDDLTAGQLRMLDASGQFLAGLKAAMAGGASTDFAAAVEGDAALLTRRQLAFERRQSVTRVMVASGAALVGAALLLAGVWWAVPIASLLTAIVVLSRMAGPALQLQQGVQQLATLLPAHAGLVALRGDLGGRPSPPAAAAAVRADADAAAGARGTIVLDGVSYAHPDGGGVTGIDLVLAPGETVGLVGASGAGKTTLVDLLAGLLTPSAGRITIGGRPPGAAARARIAYVTQDGFLVHDTIRRNLTLGGPTRDDAALWAALARVGADALVAGMPAGLDTVVAERGSRLSGGERQRVALARALLRAPTLLILDEATNAIDVAGERAILDALAAIPDRPTLVVIAHRPESLAQCERILTLAGGRITTDRPTSVS